MKREDIKVGQKYRSKSSVNIYTIAALNESWDGNYAPGVRYEEGGWDPYLAFEDGRLTLIPTKPHPEEEPMPKKEQDGKPIHSSKFSRELLDKVPLQIKIKEEDGMPMTLKEEADKLAEIESLAHERMDRIDKVNRAQDERLTELVGRTRGLKTKLETDTTLVSIKVSELAGRVKDLETRLTDVSIRSLYNKLSIEDLTNPQTEEKEQKTMTDNTKTKGQRIIETAKKAGIRGTEIAIGAQAVDIVIAGINEVMGVGKRQGFLGLADSKAATAWVRLMQDEKSAAAIRMILAGLLVAASVYMTEEDEDGISSTWTWLPDFLMEIGVNSSEAALALEVFKAENLIIEHVKPAFMKGVAAYKEKMGLGAIAAVSSEESTDEVTKLRKVQAKRQGTM